MPNANPNISNNNTNNADFSLDFALESTLDPSAGPLGPPREYSFDLELASDFYDPYKLHIAICKLSGIKPNTKLGKVFLSLACMCDPYTQPGQIGVLSIDLCTDILIGTILPNLYDDCFDLGYDLGQIIAKLMHLISIDDFTKLQSVKNDQENWEKDLKIWTPKFGLGEMVHIASDFHHLMLIFTMIVASIAIINKLCSKSNNICLNPFLKMFLQIWKNMTKVIFLGIEIDRRDEDSGFPGYPEMVRYMIKGSSAVRSMLAMVLNNHHLNVRCHDYKHEPMLNFMHPYGRKFRNGSIKADMRVFVASLLALGSDLEDVIELLFNFEPEDEFDEDIKYMFEMELENMEEFERIDNNQEEENDDYNDNDNDDNDSQYKNKSSSPPDDEYHQKHLERINQYLGIERDDKTPIMRSIRSWEVHPDCDCTFDDDMQDEEDDEDDEDDDEREEEEDDECSCGHEHQHEGQDEPTHKSLQQEIDALEHELHSHTHANESNDISFKDAISSVDFTQGLYAYRHTNSKKFEMDSKGRDWRDIPRGQNDQLTPEFIELLKKSQTDDQIFLTPMGNLISCLHKLTLETQPSSFCEKVIQSIAWVVQYEYESEMMPADESDSSINTNVIYDFLKRESNFDSLIKFNPSATFAIMDELLMVVGYRRVFIWFLTHCSLNHYLINYFYELLANMRGNVSNGDAIGVRFPFSRMGHLELSEVERNMLLHEFFSNAVIYLSRGSSSFDIGGGGSAIEEGIFGANGPDKDSNFITNRSNAQKLTSVICLVLTSLNEKGLLQLNDPEYKTEIQTLLFQWIGSAAVPNARELFMKTLEPFNESTARKAYEEQDNDDNNLQESMDHSVHAISTKISHENKEFSTLNLKHEGNQTPYSIDPEMSLKEKLVKMTGLKMYILFQHTLSVDTLELLTTILHLGAHYSLKREEIVHFTKDLNSVEKVYDDDYVEDICDLVFGTIGDEIAIGSEENVVEIAFKAGIVSSEAKLSWVRKIVNEYMQGEAEFGSLGEMEGIEDDEDDVDLLEEDIDKNSSNNKKAKSSKKAGKKKKRKT